MNGIRDKIFFLSFSAYLILFWLKIMLERGFLIFSIFFEIFLPRPSMNGNWGKFFFSLLFGLSTPVLAKNNSGKRFFLFFWHFFFYFFWNFLARAEYERNSGLKFFSLFLCQSHPVLAEYNTGKRVFNFFPIFFGIFLPGLSTNGIRD